MPTSTSRMWHTVHTVFMLFKGKGEEGQTKKKNFGKKWKEEKASCWCSQAHTRKDREEFFF